MPRLSTFDQKQQFVDNSEQYLSIFERSILDVCEDILHWKKNLFTTSDLKQEIVIWGESNPIQSIQKHKNPSFPKEQKNSWETIGRLYVDG